MSVEQDVENKIWAFETPEWETLKTDVKRLAGIIQAVMHSGDYVWRLRMASSDLHGTVNKLRAELEEKDKKIAELESEIEELRSRVSAGW
jgi:uncharacterized coiled-coil DUF342 family protein